MASDRPRADCRSRTNALPLSLKQTAYQQRLAPLVRSRPSGLQFGFVRSYSKAVGNAKLACGNQQLLHGAIAGAYWLARRKRRRVCSAQ